MARLHIEVDAFEDRLAAECDCQAANPEHLALDRRQIQQSVQVHRSRLEKVGDLLGSHDPLNGVEVNSHVFGIERKAVALDDLFELRDVASGE